MLGLNQMFSRKKTSVIKYFVPVIWALIAFPAGADVCGKNDSWCSFKWQQATAKEVVEFMSDYDIKDPALALDIGTRFIIGLRVIRTRRYFRP